MGSNDEILEDRAIITLGGPDRHDLLRGIITNSVKPLLQGKPVYAALLTAQGKFLHDFFLIERDDVIYLDCQEDGMVKLFQKLLMYRLRSNVEIIDRSADFNVVVSRDKINCDISFADPRHAKMGYRAFTKDELTGSDNSYHDRRIKLGIAEGAYDFIPEKSTILEGHFEQINGVDFEKGCYVGQEVIARMKYRGKIKKLMFPVTLSGPAPEFGSDITDEKGNKIGDLRSNCGKNAIALFRIDNLQFEQQYDCCGIKVTPHKPDFYEELSDE